MGVVLWLSNRPKVAGYTSYCVGALITIYVLLFAPVSGFRINPARSTGSAVFAHLWSSMWIYFVAPILGMLIAAEIYIRSQVAMGSTAPSSIPIPTTPVLFCAITQDTMTLNHLQLALRTSAEM